MLLPRPRAAVHDYQKVHACELIHRMDEYCPLAIMLVLTERLDADAWIRAEAVQMLNDLNIM